MKLVYFAWVRERVGAAEERRDLPPGGRTPAAVMAWLSGQGEHYAHAFENAPLIRAAADRKHVKHDADITGAAELAFFPPMTGG